MSHRRWHQIIVVSLSFFLIGHDNRTAGGEHTADTVADRDFGAGNLRRCDAAHLAHALLQGIHAVHAGVHVREAAAISVERQLAGL